MGPTGAPCAILSFYRFMWEGFQIMKKKNQAPSGAVAKQYFESAAEVQEIITSDALPAAKKSKKNAAPAALEPEQKEEKAEETPVVEEKPEEVVAESPSGDAQ